jgi:hypothetical protein
MNQNFTLQCIFVHTSGFTSHPKEDVLRIFIALKNPSPRPDMNPRTLGPMASTPTNTPPRRLLKRSFGAVFLRLDIPRRFLCNR